MTFKEKITNKVIIKAVIYEEPTDKINLLPTQLFIKVDYTTNDDHFFSTKYATDTLLFEKHRQDLCFFIAKRIMELELYDEVVKDHGETADIIFRRLLDATSSIQQQIQEYLTQ